MTDDDKARAAAWAQHEHRFTAEGAEAYAHGWKDALAHARRWRPLTDDPPEDGQWVLLYNGEVTDDVFLAGVSPGHLALEGWTHWLPLPPPSEEER